MVCNGRNGKGLKAASISLRLARLRLPDFPFAFRLGSCRQKTLGPDNNASKTSVARQDAPCETMSANIATNPVGVDNQPCYNGELLRGRKGDVVYLPKGIPHAPRVLGNDGLTVVVVCVPGGFDRFFAACAEEFKKGEPELPLLVKLAAEYGIEFQFGLPS